MDEHGDRVTSARPPRRRWRPTLAVLVGVLALALAVAACGGGGGKRSGVASLGDAGSASGTTSAGGSEHDRQMALNWARYDQTTRTPDPEGQVRSRRRGGQLEDALLRAAWEEVSTVGYAKLTMEGVAARAGTSKPVLYRRWPNRAALVLSATRHRLASITSEIPDTGDLRQDVLTVLRQFRDRYQQVPPDITHGLMTELPDMPNDVFEVVPGVMMTILGHAAARGEVRLDKVTPRVAALPGDLLRHDLLLSHGHVPDASLAEIADDIFLPLVTA